MREMVLAALPASGRGSRLARELAGHLDVLCAASSLPGRLEALVDLNRWTRAWSGFRRPGAAGEALPAPATLRLRMLLDLLEGAPEVRARFHDAIEGIIGVCRGVDLFATAGIPTDRGFLAELGDRLMEHLLPEPRDDDDLAKLLRTLFQHPYEVSRFLRVPPEIRRRSFLLLVPLDRPAVWARLRSDFADAFRLLAARVQATGLAENLRARSRPGPVTGSPFFRLARSSDAVLAALASGEGMERAAADWRSDCAGCREAMAEIHRRLESEGVSVAIVFGLEVLERCLLRMDKMVRLMAAGSPEEQADAVFELLGKLVLASQQDRSLRHLLSWGTHLLHRKIVERAGKTGEHYIARNLKEYRHIWLAAAGGGVVTVFTAAIKMYLSGLHLPAFQEGFTTGLNYAVSFLVLQRFGLILATKQPAMTAATLAAIVREEHGAERRGGHRGLHRPDLPLPAGGGAGQHPGGERRRHRLQLPVAAGFRPPLSGAQGGDVRGGQPAGAAQRHGDLRLPDRRDPVAGQPRRRVVRQLGGLPPPAPRDRRAPAGDPGWGGSAWSGGAPPWPGAPPAGGPTSRWASCSATSTARAGSWGSPWTSATSPSTRAPWPWRWPAGARCCPSGRSCGR